MTNEASGAVLLIMIIGILLVTGIWATGSVVEAQATDTDVTDEPVSVTTGWSELAASGDRYHSETVTNSTATLEEGTDYYWNPDDGEIAFNNTRHPSGSSVNVSYTASELPDRTAAFVSVLGPLWNMGAVLPLVALVGAIFGGLAYLHNQQNRGGAY
jgi:hypothetical protein